MAVPKMPGWFLPTINSSHSTADRRAVWSPDLLTGADGCQNTMGSGMRSQSNTLDNISQPPLLGKMPLSSRYPEVEFEKSTTGALIRKNATRYSLLLVLISVMATWFYICPVPLPVFFRSATGKTVTYNWDISWVLANPDGELVRPVIGINGEWPLPTLYADVGDRVIVNVKNSLGNETTSIHWHGLFQRGSTAMDGPVGVTQCPIPADGTMTYNFKITQPGTYFYHSHSHGQYPDGLRGAIIIHDPRSPYKNEYDEEIVVTLSDWYHEQVPVLTKLYLDPIRNPDAAEPIPYSALINDSQNTKIYVEPSKTYFVRFINMAGFAQMYFAFDQHDMTIIEIDGIYTKPRKVSQLYIATAQRYGVLLKTKSDTSKNYAALGMMDQEKFDSIPAYLSSNVTAYLVYDDNKPMPKELNLMTIDVIDDFLLYPQDGMQLLETPDQIITLNLDFFDRDEQNRAGFNDITYLEQRVPSIFTALTTGASAMNPGVYGVNANAYVLKKGDIVELVVNNFDDGAHPMHLHGHTAQLVARAPGVYHPPSADPKSHHHHGKEGQQETLRDIMGYAGDTSKMPRSPMRRDTWIVAENGYTVLRFVADNPGVWFFHCHMDWHLSAGLAATLVVAPLELQKTQSVPKAFQDMCRAQGIPISGNAAGNTEDFLNLTGANTVCPPL